MLSEVGTSKKFLLASEIGKTSPLKPSTSAVSDGSFLATFIDHSMEVAGGDTVLTKFYKQFSDVEKLSLHYLFSEYFLTNDLTNPGECFIEFCKNHMNNKICSEAEQCTIDQANNPLWHELRYCRITASKAYEVMNCNTPEGTLMETILGAAKLKDTSAMKKY